MKGWAILVVVWWIGIVGAKAQDSVGVKQQIRSHIDVLAAPAMKGRGYVEDGQGKAAQYIAAQMKEMGLQPLSGMADYRQYYSFEVNTFPGKVQLNINGKQLRAGVDYLVDANSASAKMKENITVLDLQTVTDTTKWNTVRAGLTNDKIWMLKNVDSFCKVMKLRKRDLAEALPAGVYIVPERGKQFWTVGRRSLKATVLYVQDSVLPATPLTAKVHVEAHYKELKSSNVIGYVKGTAVPDSYLVFSAHYDHLGMMGKEAIFAGASDNASGTAMVLYMAKYFAANPLRYSCVFIAFSGEEAGLLGSDYFTKHSPIPLSNIRFVTNVDIMGDASNGVTVVNATELPNEYNKLVELNSKRYSLPEVKSRGKTSNSDHYHFYERGVPAFFIYSNGGKGYYHDVFDVPAAITLHKIPDVASLLIDFATGLSEKQD